MKKILTFLLMFQFLALTGVVYAQNCDFHIRTEVTQATCYNNGKVLIIPVDNDGNEPINPVVLCKKAHITDWTSCMRLCITALMKCDNIYLLDDWYLSRGARLEYLIANLLNIRILNK